MENIVKNTVEVVKGYYVTTDEVVEVDILKLQVKGLYNPAQEVYRYTVEGWVKCTVYSHYSDIADTIEEARALQKDKIARTIEAVKENQEREAKRIAELEAKLQD